ncbi:MAG: hypothetical protein WC291_09500 [Thermodesulfovibrionales bacterium]|jgi:hypothetical protein
MDLWRILGLDSGVVKGPLAMLIATECDCLAANCGLQGPDEELQCLAHLDSGRVHWCPIFYCPENFIGGGLGGCVDFTPRKGSEDQIIAFVEAMRK